MFSAVAAEVCVLRPCSRISVLPACVSWLASGLLRPRCLFAVSALLLWPLVCLGSAFPLWFGPLLLSLLSVFGSVVVPSSLSLSFVLSLCVALPDSVSVRLSVPLHF